MAQYSTALSYIFLAATSFYCVKSLYPYKLTYCIFSYSLIAIHSILGVWRWGNPIYGHKIDKLYRLTERLQDLLVLPCIVTTIWLRYNYSFYYLCAHIIFSLIPLLTILLFYHNRQSRPIEAFLLGNVLSLLVFSTINNNQFGISTSMAFIISYFIIRRGMLANLPIEVPTQDLFNYSLCFFAVFALNAIFEPMMMN